MSNTNQRPPAKGTSDSMWNTRFETNAGKHGATNKPQTWNVPFEYPADHGKRQVPPEKAR